MEEQSLMLQQEEWDVLTAHSRRALEEDQNIRAESSKQRLQRLRQIHKEVEQLMALQLELEVCHYLHLLQRAY